MRSILHTSGEEMTIMVLLKFVNEKTQIIFLFSLLHAPGQRKQVLVVIT